MSIICNNLIIGKKEEPTKKVPPTNPNAIENLSVIERKVDDSELVVTKKKTHSIKNKNVNFHNGYHIVQEGDLHRMVNAKSDYLRDMLDLDN